MTHLTIAPNGPVEFGTVTLADGETYVRLEFTDADGHDTVALQLRAADFVALADHLKMASDAVLAGKFDAPR